MAATRWNLEVIKQGIDAYREEFGYFPTAFDFDKCSYLPSARQVQRSFGGLESLRTQLGYKELNYTKGALRRSRSIAGFTNGTLAEDELEKLLIEFFGEPYVHTQKRYYKDHKNRYDFFIYYQEGYLGVDIFTTSRIEYIGPNLRHKITKYRNVPQSTPIIFVVASENLSSKDIRIGALT
ncbi:MAG: hypothetical protein ABIR46_00800, partial [Candidatus Saccharimonadales bacterium]